MASVDRSLRLQARSASNLDSSGNTNGEVFFDTTNQTLRVFNGTTRGGSIIANRDWVVTAIGELGFNGDYNSLRNKPVLFSGAYAALVGKPNLATVATSGDYRDLAYTPAIPTDISQLTDNNHLLGQGGVTVDLTGYATQTYVNTAVSAITKTSLGLGNVTNESKATMFTSPTFTGTVALPAGSTVGGNAIANTGNVTFTGNTISTTTGNITVNKTTTFTNGIAITGPISASINALSDVDTLTTPPTSGQVLKWNGTNWAPAADATSGGGGSNADTLGGFSSTYFLDYNNLNNRPDLTLYATLNSPTFTGNVQGLTSTMVGLSDVTNESKAVMFTNPTFTGHPTIEGVTSTGATGTGALVFGTSPTLTTPTIGTTQITGFSGTGSTVALATGATLTTPTIAGVQITGKTGTSGVLVMDTGATLTNTTFSGTVSGITKSTVGLGNVENTALSSWTGSTFITSTGTVTTGTWASTLKGNNDGAIFNLGTAGGTIAPNVANGNVQRITLNAALTMNGFTSPVAGQRLRLFIYGGTAYTTITSTMKFVGGVKTLTGTAGCIDVLEVYYDGTTYFAQLLKNFV